MNIGVIDHFRLYFCQDICTRVGLLDHMATLYLFFLGTSVLFSIVTIPIYIPTNSVGGLKVYLFIRPLLVRGSITHNKPNPK